MYWRIAAVVFNMGFFKNEIAYLLIFEYNVSKHYNYLPIYSFAKVCFIKLI